MSAVTIAEIQKGISKLARNTSNSKADALRAWLNGLLEAFGPFVLPVDIPVALVAGDFEDHAASKGQHPGTADIFIAATAKANNLVLVTNNLRHFDFLDLAVLAPNAI